MKILLVEDEMQLAEALQQVLKKNHYSVDLAYDGEYGLDCALSAIYDIIILDIMLPKRDGLSLLKELRKQHIATPVILLTARGQTEDKVRGLDCGADDYLAKPFPTEELLARLRALGRRKGDLKPDGLLRYSDIALNPHTLELTCANGGIKLTLKESQLLELFLTRPERILAKDTIIEKLWGYDSEAEDNHVEVYISFLRKKLNHLQVRAAIQTVRGVGYILETR